MERFEQLTEEQERTDCVVSVEARTDLDMLQVDRLRAWARNIRSHGPDISNWGSPSFVADEADRIASDIERSIKRWTPGGEVNGGKVG